MSETIRPKVVRFTCKGAFRPIPAEALASVSERTFIFQDEAAVIVLDEFNQLAALDFLPQFIETRQIVGNMSFIVLSELFRLADLLNIPSMKALMEDYLVTLNVQNPLYLVKSLLIAEKFRLPRIRDLIILARNCFGLLVNADNYHYLPLECLLSILSSCRIPGQNELMIIDAALLWLSRQEERDEYIYAVFNLIRTNCINPYWYIMTMQRVAELNFSEESCCYISSVLYSENAARACYVYGVWSGISSSIRDAQRNDPCSCYAPIPALQQMPLSKPDDSTWLNKNILKELKDPKPEDK